MSSLIGNGRSPRFRAPKLGLATYDRQRGQPTVGGGVHNIDVFCNWCEPPAKHPEDAVDNSGDNWRNPLEANADRGGIFKLRSRTVEQRLSRESPGSLCREGAGAAWGPPSRHLSQFSQRFPPHRDAAGFSLATPCCRSVSSARRPASVMRTRPAAIALVIGLDGRAVCCCKPGAHEADQRLACEAVGMHSCLRGAERNAGEQLKRPPLFRAEMMFSRKRNAPHDAPIIFPGLTFSSRAANAAFASSSVSAMPWV
jgi:hypothetical protein